MTAYEAIVKVPLGASEEERVRALRQGIEDIIHELITERAIDADDVLETCESAIEDALIEAGDVG